MAISSFEPIFIRIRFFVLLVLFLPFCGLSQNSEKASYIQVKFTPEFINSIETSVVQQDDQGILMTGIHEIDSLAQVFRLENMERVFPYNERFDKRHRAHGLHLWYRFSASSVEFSPMSCASSFEKCDFINLSEAPLEKHFNDGYDERNLSMLTVDDPSFDSQWHYENTGQTGGRVDADIDLSAAWDIQTGQPDVLVAIIDGGLEVDHQDLAANVWVNVAERDGVTGVDDDGNGYIDDINGYGFGDRRGDFLPHYHGVHVAGTVGAVNNNGIGVSGVAGGSGVGDGVKMMSCAVFGSYSNDGFDVAFVYAADNGAVIAQNSWGYTSPGVYEESVLDAIDYFVANAGYDEMGDPVGPMQGGLVVFAAGNSNSSADYYPGYYEPVMAVASTDHNDRRSSFSNYGDWVDIAAPGSNVLSTYPGNSYSSLSGTSMACPHVSGVAALIVSEFGETGYQPAQVWGRLEGTTDGIDDLNPGYEELLGSGRLNAFNSLQTDTGDPPATISDLLIADLGGTSITINWTAPGASGDEGVASSYDARFSTSAIDDANFDDATRISDFIRPSVAGASEAFIVPGLSPTTTYYFAIKTSNFFGNESEISNVVMGETTDIPTISVSPESLQAILNEGESTTLNFTISNEGNDDLNFSIPEFTAPLALDHVVTNETSYIDFGINEVEKGATDNRVGHPVTLGTGDDGDDGFGYRWIDSNEPGGPTFVWNDITSDGTQIHLSDDDYESVSLPFTFPFYGDDKHVVYISSNGFLSFSTDGVTTYSNNQIPVTATPNDLIAPYWDDLYPPASGAEIHYLSSDNEFIVQYTNMDYYSLNPPKGLTFQVVLNENGNIDFRYLEMHDLSSATIGIENRNGDEGLQVAFNTSYVEDNLAILISQGERFITNVTPISGSVAAGASLNVSVDIDAMDVSPGNHEEIIPISSNDPLNPIVDLKVALHVNGVPEIYLSTTAIDYGEAFVSSADSVVVEMSNVGTDTLTISSVVVDEVTFDIEVETLPITLLAGEKSDVTVFFRPTSIGSYNGSLEITSDDPNNPTQIVTLEGSAVDPPVIDVSPTALTSALNSGETEVQTLSIDNLTGSSDLEYQIIVETINAAAQSGPSEISEYNKMQEIPADLDYVDNVVFVVLKEGLQSTELNELKTDLQVSEIKDFKYTSAELWTLSGLSTSDAINRLYVDDRVLYAEPDYIVQAIGVPGDPRFDELWGLHNIGQSGGTADADIDAIEAWDLSTSSASMVVGIIDTGIDYNHQDLDDNMWINADEIADNGIDDDGNGYIDDIYGWDFVNNDNDPMDGHSHGTHVAGTVGAEGNNGIGVAGVTWDVQLMALKFLSDGGSGSTSNAILAIEYAIDNGANLTNNSWGGGAFSQTLKDVIDASNDANQLFVAAAGNSGLNTDINPQYPAAYASENIISVAATDRNDQLASFSNYGQNSVDLGAPGVDILSSTPGNSYASFSGTSMASPHVAGAIALSWAQIPGASNMELKSLLLETVDPIAAVNGVTVSGGRLNLNELLKNTNTWLEIGVMSGTVAAGGSQEIDVTFNAIDLFGGTYEANFIISSNDPIAPTTVVPVELQVTGVPDIEASVTSLIFGERFIGTTNILPVTIRNEGTDLLTITDVVSSDTHFTSDNTSFDIGHGESLEINISYAPTLVQLDEGTITILSNDPDEPSLEITLTGHGVLPPELVSSPDTIGVGLFTGGTSSELLYISNDGGSDLFVSLEIGTTSPLVLNDYAVSATSFEGRTLDGEQFKSGENSARMLSGADLNDVRIGFYEQGLMETFRSELAARGGLVDSYGSFSPNSLDTLDVFVLDDRIASLSTSDLTAIREWVVNAGGHLLLLGDDSGNDSRQNEILEGSGISTMVFGTYYSESFADINEHPSTSSVAILSAGAYGAYFELTGAAEPIVLNSDGQVFAAVSNLGRGLVYVVGDEGIFGDYEISTDDNGQYGNQIIDFLSVGSVQWLELSHDQDTIIAGGTTEIELIFDATGLNGGIYSADLQLSSNDPITSEVSIPVGLEVTGAPHLEVSRSELDFGVHFVGAEVRDTLVLSNEGTDDLEISNITSDNADFTIDWTNATLPPGEEHELIVTYIPTTVAVDGGLLTITSNDTDESELNIGLLGEGVAPPVFVVDTDSIGKGLFTGGSTSHALTIENTGGSDLIIEASVLSTDISVSRDKSQDIVRTNLDSWEYSSMKYSSSALHPESVLDLPFVEGFESGDLNSWTVDGVTGTREIVTDQANKGARSFHYDNVETGHFHGISQEFAVGSQPEYVSFYVRSISNTAHDGYFVLTSGGNEVIWFYMTGEGTLYVNEDVGGDNDVTYDANQWYRIEFRDIDWTDKDFDYYVNNVLVKADISFRSAAQVSDIDVVHLHNFDSSESWWDDIQIGGSSVIWLTADTEADTIPAGSSDDILLTFDATGLNGGVYSADLQLSSNDPITSEVSIPVGLEVTGAPHLEVSASELDFGVHFVGAEVRDTLILSNEGTDDLEISNITSDNADFTVDLTSTILAPGGKQELIVTYIPTSVAVDGGLLTIASNDTDEPELDIDLLGEGVAAPVFVVDTDSIGIALFTGGSTTHALTIENTGGSDLVVDVSVTHRLGHLADIFPSSTQPGFAGNSKEASTSDQEIGELFSEDDADILVIQNSIAWGLTMSDFLEDNFSITPHVIGYGSISSTDLSDYDIVITLGDQSSAYYNALNDNKERFEDFVRLGGTLQYQLATQGLDVEVVGGVTVNFNIGGNFNTVVSPTHPIVSGLPISLEGNSANHGYLTDLPGDAEVIVETSTGSLPTMATYRYGAGNVTVTTMTVEFLYINNYNSAPLLGRLFQYSLDNSQVSWLSFSPENETVAPGETAEIELAFDATGLNGGLYSADLQLSSNDPLTSEVSIPIGLEVTGAPHLEVSVSELDFGSHFVGAEISDTLVLSNEGTDDLEVSNITSDNADFTVDWTSTTIAPGAEQELIVTYMPASVAVDAGLLTITSNDTDESDLDIGLLGEGVAAPVFVVDTDSIGKALFTGGSTTHALTIENTGGSDLIIGTTVSFANEAGVTDWFDFYGQKLEEGSNEGKQGQGRVGLIPMSEIEALSGSVNILAWTKYADMNREYPNTLNAISQYFTDYSVSTTATLIASDLETLLSDKDVLLIPEQEGGSTSTFINLGTAWAEVLQNFVSTGGVVVQCGSAYGAHELLNSSGLLLSNYDDYVSGGQAMTIENVEHPLLEGTSGTVNARNATFLLDISDASSETLVTYNGSVAIAENELGGGLVIYLGYDFWDYDDNAAKIISNAVRSSSRLSSWLSVDIEADTIPAGSSEEILLTFDATGLNGGLYSADLQLSSNDPITSEVSIPVGLDVTGVPHLEVSVRELDFGVQFVGSEVTDTLVLSNEGTDDLEVSTITSDNAHFTVDWTSATLAPGEEQELIVTYIPTTVAVDEGLLTIASNDTDEPELDIDLLGEGVAAPVFVVDTDSIGKALFTGGSSTHALTIENTGGSDLIVDVSVTYGLVDLVDIFPSGTQSVSAGNSKEASTSDQEIGELFSEGDADILVIQNSIAWGLTMSDFLEDNFSITPHVIGYGSISSTDLSDYDIVITLGDQSSAYYNALSDNKEKFEDFVRLGGTLQYQLATQGPDVDVVGGVTVNFNIGENFNTVVSPTHPIVSGLPISLEGNSANHGYLTDLPGDAEVIVETSAGSLPTMATYRYGAGNVTVTTMTVEFLYINNYNSAPLLGRLFQYSLDNSQVSWLSISPENETVAPGETVEIELAFDATDLNGGLYSADLQLRSNDPVNSEISIPIGLEVTASPDIVISDSEIEFGEGVTEEVWTKELVISNNGLAELNVTSLSIDELEFTADKSSITLDPSESEVIVITFSSSEVGSYTGILTISSNDLSEPELEVMLSGEVIATPDIGLSSSNLDLGSTATDVSVSEVLTITNSGESELTISSMAIDAQGYELDKSSATIAAGAIEEVVISFTSGTVGTYAGTLTILSDDPDTPNVGVGLSTEVIATPNIELSSSSLDLGSTATDALVSEVLTITNSGESELTISSMTIDGEGFELDKNSATIAAGAIEEITISFLSGTAGTYVGTLSILSDDPDNSQIAIDLQSTVYGIADLYIEEDTLDLGTVGFYESVQVEVSIENVGDVDLEVTNITSDDDSFSFDQSTLTIVPGASSTVTVYANLQNAGTNYGALKFTSNDPGEEEKTIVVVFERLGPPAISVSTSTLEFGAFANSVNVTDEITVYNTGASTLDISEITVDNSYFWTNESVLSISPGDSVTMEVNYSTTEIGIHSGVMTFISNDPTQSTHEMGVTGSVYIPSVSVTDSEIDFGAVYEQSSISYDLDIQNNGAGLLNILSMNTGHDYFTVSSSATHIASGSSMTITVAFAPMEIGSFESELTIETDATDLPVINLDLIGSGISAAPQIVSEIEDLTMPVEEIQSRSLNSYFSDPLEGQLDYEFSYDEELLTVSMEDGILSLTGLKVGSGQVMVTAGNGVRSTTQQFTVTIENALPVVLIQLDDQLINVGDVVSIDLSDVFYDANDEHLTYSYTADAALDVSIDGSNTMHITALDETSSEIIVSATDSFNESVSMTFGINVSDIVDPTLSISSSEIDVKVYPNPGIGDLYLGGEFQNENLVKLEVYDLSGSRIDFTYNDSEHLIRLTQPEEGMYFLKLQFQDQKVVIRKFYIKD